MPGWPDRPEAVVMRRLPMDEWWWIKWEKGRLCVTEIRRWICCGVKGKVCQKTAVEEDGMNEGGPATENWAGANWVEAGLGSERTAAKKRHSRSRQARRFADSRQPSKVVSVVCYVPCAVRFAMSGLCKQQQQQQEQQQQCAVQCNGMIKVTEGGLAWRIETDQRSWVAQATRIKHVHVHQHAHAHATTPDDGGGGDSPAQSPRRVNNASGHQPNGSAQCALHVCLVCPFNRQGPLDACSWLVATELLDLALAPPSLPLLLPLLSITPPNTTLIVVARATDEEKRNRGSKEGRANGKPADRPTTASQCQGNSVIGCIGAHSAAHVRPPALSSLLISTCLGTYTAIIAYQTFVIVALSLTAPVLQVQYLPTVNMVL
ncbi:hypothetical protein DM02DRAFT_731253 [Periconia macrospinosa]|uniref:Uncharacterized protein n=1 Tax=Periconia macrospinosa TaxID=97972 RepID=A0A2V1DE28_9PLEO|nr:hypothetical protein DM02DRAFT_731253 [Periconia macrospinosa]